MALVPTIWLSELPLLALRVNVYRMSAPIVSLKRKDTKFMLHFIRQDGNQHLLSISQILETVKIVNIHHFNQFILMLKAWCAVSCCDKTPWLTSPWGGKGLFQVIVIFHHKQKSGHELNGELGGRNRSRVQGWRLLTDLLLLTLLSYTTQDQRHGHGTTTSGLGLSTSIVNAKTYLVDLPTCDLMEAFSQLSFLFLDNPSFS